MSTTPTTKNEIIFLGKLEAFAKATRELDAAWQDLDSKVENDAAKNYPRCFDSFDEVRAQVDVWEDSMFDKRGA